MHRTLPSEDVFSKPFEEAHLILVIFIDRRFFYPPDDDVMQCSGYIKAGLSRHDVIVLKQDSLVKRKA